MSMASSLRAVGLGSSDAAIKVYVANRPPLDEYLHLDEVRAMREGEIKQIADLTGNHWRKIFNVYAKFVWALKMDALTKSGYQSWQQYRDEHLLQSGSGKELLFTAPVFNQTSGDVLHIIMGKGYAAALNLPPLIWLNELFAINVDQRIIVCPYFDYRQLSNVRIEFLVALIHKYFPGEY